MTSLMKPLKQESSWSFPSFLTCTMEHITKYHIHKQNMKSTFVAGLDVEQLIDDVLSHLLVKQKHRTKPN